MASKAPHSEPIYNRDHEHCGESGKIGRDDTAQFKKLDNALLCVFSAAVLALGGLQPLRGAPILCFPKTQGKVP